MRGDHILSSTALLILLGALASPLSAEPVKIHDGFVPGPAVGYGAAGSAFPPVTTTTPLPVDSGRTLIASASLTTTASVTAYASGQLIANAASAAAVTPLAFPACRVAGGSGMIRRVRLKTTDSAFVGGTVRVHFHRDAPVFANGDHAAWLTNESDYLGAFDVTVDRSFSDASKGIGGTPLVGNEIDFVCAPGSSTIYAELEARSAIVPHGGKTITIAAEILAN